MMDLEERLKLVRHLIATYPDAPEGTEQHILICPIWPGRNANISKRKISCLCCKAMVAVHDMNLPNVLKFKTIILCQDCAKLMLEELGPEAKISPGNFYDVK